VAIDPDFGLHAVHRLDKETSGLVLLAGHPNLLRYFAVQFTNGTVIKQYQALLHGHLSEGPDRRQWQSWQWPLTLKAAGRANIAGSGERAAALTHYRVTRLTPRYTLVECRLATGRTHQIRRHSALAGHAVVGDQRYGSPRAARFVQQLGFTRLALHASLLSLCVPEDKESTVFATPNLPQSMIQLLEMDCHGSESRF
jgi:23S rRNA-/tRNA-specific pseudouridylate synthase